VQTPDQDLRPIRQVVIQWPTAQNLRKWLLYTLGAVILCYLVYVVRDIWVPLLLAFLIATVLDPVVDRLEMRGWTRAAAASLIYGVFLAVLITAIVLAYPHVVAQLGLIQQGFAQKFPDTSPAGISKSLRGYGLAPTFSDMIVKVYQGTLGTFKSSNRMAEYGATVATNVIWLVIIPIISFYALRDYHLILAKALLLVPREKRDLVQTAVAETTGVFAKYLRAMGIVSLLNGFATWLLLYIFHVPSALVIGIGATILYNVPYLGAIAINAMIAAVSFLYGGVHTMAIVTGIGLVMHNVLFDQIISPRILGGHVGLHPILSIIALLVGNLLLGVVGMVLAVPVAACIQMGILALIPKLKHEIDLPKHEVEVPAEAEHVDVQPDTVEQLQDETLEIHTKTDATEELHRSVNTAVESIEDKIVEAKAAELEEARQDAEAAEAELVVALENSETASAQHSATKKEAS